MSFVVLAYSLKLFFFPTVFFQTTASSFNHFVPQHNMEAAE